MRTAVAAAVALLLAVPAVAATLGEAATGFSADRTLTIDNKTYQGRIWTMPGKERHEQTRTREARCHRSFFDCALTRSRIFARVSTAADCARTGGASANQVASNG